MKKLILLLSLTFISCEADDEQCFKTAICTNGSVYPKTFLVESYPYDCETGKPLPIEDKHIYFLRWQ